MEPQGPSAKRTRSQDVTAGEPPPRATEAKEAANLGPPTHTKQPPPPPPDAGGGGGCDVDRISGLPDAVLGEIVSLLSTKEAGRTQILASRWRHVWRASSLVLDGTDLYTEPKVFFWDDKEYTAANEALASAVSFILSAHPGPGRRFCIPPYFLHDRLSTVDAWLNSPALVNLQELEFWKRHEMQYRGKEPSQLAPLPASAFRFSATLRVATFSKCQLLYSSVEGIQFPYLKQLGLEDVSISEGSLRTIISSCLVLECLLLKNISWSWVGCLRISSNSLRSIGVGADYLRDDLRFEVIIVNAPCLERFLYLGNGDPLNLTVISAPKLEALGCLKDDGMYDARIVIGTTAIQGLNVVSLTTALSNVKILAVATWAAHRGIDLDTVIELLKCFPCLEKLYMKSRISGVNGNRWLRKHRDFIKSFDIRLKTIVLHQYSGFSYQVNFASFFLLNATELESMRLHVAPKDYNEAFFTEQHGMLKMEKRASRGARLHFLTKECIRHVHVSHVSDLSLADPFECTRC